MLPNKNKARSALTQAIKKELVKRPNACMDCGTVTRVQGHHTDYSMPLVVDWLCSKCHFKRHFKNGKRIHFVGTSDTIIVRIDADVWELLIALAKKNGRTLKGTIRFLAENAN